MMLFVFKYKDRIGLFIYGMRKKSPESISGNRTS